ncbi:MAG: response regulator [Steroidobacteraceae bacterium]
MKTVNTAPTHDAHGSPVRRRILVLESDRLLRSLLAEWLDMSGNDVLCLADSETALARADRFDMVLVDLPTPQRAARQAVSQLRRAMPGTPIVAMSADVTASGHAAQEILARELGAAALLVKPFTRSALLNAMNRARA